MVALLEEELGFVAATAMARVRWLPRAHVRNSSSQAYWIEEFYCTILCARWEEKFPRVSGLMVGNHSRLAHQRVALSQVACCKILVITRKLGKSQGILHFTQCGRSEITSLAFLFRSSTTLLIEQHHRFRFRSVNCS